MRNIELMDGTAVEAFCGCDEEWLSTNEHPDKEGQNCIPDEYLLDPGSDSCEKCGFFMWTRKLVGGD